jgi:hypothetical protein
MHRMSAALLKGGKDSPKGEIEINSDGEEINTKDNEKSKKLKETPKYKILMQGVVKEMKGTFAQGDVYKLYLTD